MIRKFPLLATILMLIGVSILCALGTWQVKRLAWKEGIVADLSAAYSAGDAAPLPVSALQAGDPSFAYGQVSGRLLFDKALLLGPRVLEKQVGNSLILPFALEDGGSVLVNMGWTDNTLAQLALPYAPAHVTITGLARKPYWNSFTPENNPAQEAWYRPDITQIADAKDLSAPLPYILYAEAIDGFIFDNFPRNERWAPVNNHAHYAVFWFSMAGILIGIYVLRFFVMGRNNER